MISNFFLNIRCKIKTTNTHTHTHTHNINKYKINGEDRKSRGTTNKTST